MVFLAQPSPVQYSKVFIVLQTYDEHVSVLHEEQNTGAQTLFDKKKLNVELWKEA